MKRSILFAAALGLGLVAAASTVHAQALTGTTDLSNINPNDPSYTGDWNSVTATNILSTPTGLEFQVNNGGTPQAENPNHFSTMYYPIPAGQVTTMNAADTQVKFNFIWNSGNAVAGVNVIFAMGGASGADYYFSGYNVPTPGLNSYTFPLGAENLHDVQTTGILNGLNFQIDPANVYGPYDITYSSITLSQVPEPASFGIATMATLFLAARRRRSAVKAV
jgi:hypothetical protein